jgi:hypothetical protein
MMLLRKVTSRAMKTGVFGESFSMTTVMGRPHQSCAEFKTMREFGDAAACTRFTGQCI